MENEEYEKFKNELYDLQIQIELLDHRQITLVKRLEDIKNDDIRRRNKN